MKKTAIRKLKRALSAFLGAALSVYVFTAVPNVRVNVNATSDSISEKKDKIKELEDRNQQIAASIAAIDDDITQSERKQELYWEKLLVAQKQLDTYNNMLYLMEQDITVKQADIDALDLQITDKETDIDQKEKDIEKLRLENEENLDRFGKILHAMYVTENTDIFSVLAESTDIYDLLVRTKMLINVSRQNEEMMEALKKSIEDVEKRKQQLEEDKADLEASRTKAVEEKKSLESDKTELEEKRKEEQRLSNEYTDSYNKYSQEITDFEQRQKQLESEKQANAAEIAAYQEQIEREIKAAQEGSNQQYQEGDWWWPLETQFNKISTYFGNDVLYGQPRFHYGIDIYGGGIFGHPIYASKAGTVIIAKNTYIAGYSYGKYVVIDHGDGYSTLYGHASELCVSVGQVVEQGETIAYVGSTGNSTGPHLHFEVRVNNVAQDPFNYVTLP